MYTYEYAFKSENGCGSQDGNVIFLAINENGNEFTCTYLGFGNSESNNSSQSFLDGKYDNIEILFNNLKMLIEERCAKNGDYLVEIYYTSNSLIDEIKIDNIFGIRPIMLDHILDAKI